jgi:hypothetical protein
MMQAAGHAAAWHLKGTASGSEPGVPESKAEESLETREPEAPLCCARCGHVVTRERHRMAYNGRHSHTRVNPYGLVFHFGCFAQAEGCTAEGFPTLEATWFPGYAWQVAHCAACRAHLGWVFRGDGDFFGLLLDRLTLPS